MSWNGVVQNSEEEHELEEVVDAAQDEIDAREEAAALHRSNAFVGRRGFRTHIDLVEDEDKPKIYTTAAGKRPMRVELLDEEEDLEEEEEPEQDEEIMEHAGRYKREFSRSLLCTENYADFYKEPDLRTYFSEFDLTPHQQIAMCRTYANYLTQQLRASGRMAPARAKKHYKKN